MSNAIGSSRESNPSRRICHLHAVPLGHVAVLSTLHSLPIVTSSTIFMTKLSDFVTQTTRFDRLVVTSIGLFTSLCSATIFSFATSTLTCFGVGTVSCLPGLMAMAVSMGLLLKQPLYGQNRPHDPYVHNAKLISDVQKLYASKHQLYLDDKVRFSSYREI